MREAASETGTDDLAVLGKWLNNSRGSALAPASVQSGQPASVMEVGMMPPLKSRTPVGEQGSLATPVDHFITAAELAAILRVSLLTLYHWSAKEPSKLPQRYKHGKKLLFQRRQVETWLQDLAIPNGAVLAQSTRPGRPTKVQQQANDAAKARGETQSC